MTNPFLSCDLLIFLLGRNPIRGYITYYIGQLSIGILTFRWTVVAFSLKAKLPNHDLPKSEDKMPIHGNVQSVS